MPRWDVALNAKLNEYQAYLRARKRREGTFTEYRRLIREAFGSLHEAGLNCYPRTVGEEEVSYLYNELYAGLSQHVARTQLSIVGTFLKRMASNPVLEEMNLEWPEDERLSVKWLEPTRALALLQAAQGLERILVHLELCCLMRRCEVMRLGLQDFKGGAIEIDGKGRSGGKHRTIPYHPRTQGELDYYLRLREETITTAQETGPDASVPDEILIYARAGRLGAYRETAIDAMVKSAGARAGLGPYEVSNHVLRRTGARMMKKAGARTITIMRILGHSTEEQTLRYIGWGIDEAAEDMQLMDGYLSNLGQVPVTGTKTA